MSSFTPGPWEVGPVDDTVVTHLGADGTRYEVAAIDGDYNDPDTWPIMEANARLIAAAPDMLAALRPFVKEAQRLGLSSLRPDDERLTVTVNAGDIRAALAAIAKAEGKPADVGRPVPKHGSGP